MSKLGIFFINLFTKAVRGVEFLVSGESGYSPYIPGVDTKPELQIKNHTLAVELLNKVKKIIATEFNVTVRNPVVLELADLKTSYDKFAKYGVGRYKSQMIFYEKYHLIYIISGLSKNKFTSIVAHELMHAYIYEQNFFTQNKPLREALARWMEYHFLILIKENSEAKKLLKIRKPEYGGKLNILLQLEKEHDSKELIPWLIGNKDSEKIKQLARSFESKQFI